MPNSSDSAENRPEIPRGVDLLRNPFFNKGTAFTEAERDALGIRGLLPPQVSTLDVQKKRVLGNLETAHDDLEKYIYMSGLLERSETLFYSAVTEHIETLMPIIYTPTVGLACQQFGNIFRFARGIHVSIHDAGNVETLLRNWPHKDVKVIVVTDGERILGLGDLGSNGMGIPIGKLALYTACAGIGPQHTLPVVIDVGTNNEALLDDPLYLGLKGKRVRGAAYDALLEEFVQAALKCFPGVLIQFEDFANSNAFALLDRYRGTVKTFNDDIQGTAGVTLAGLLSAVEIVEQPLRDQRLLFLGAGAAGTGIADLIVEAMVAEGLDEAAARERCWFVDSRGLVVASRENLAEHKLPYAHDAEQITTLAEAVELVKPTALIGVSGQPRTFTQPIIERMAALNNRPIIFALSNPTTKSECTAEEAYTWSNGRAIFASGSPFDPVDIEGKRFVPGQGNNVYIFPGVGLGVIGSGAKIVTDEMFLSAARALASEVSDVDRESGLIYPEIGRIRDVSLAIATAVAEVAYDAGLTERERPADIRANLAAQMWEPVYESFV